MHIQRVCVSVYIYATVNQLKIKDILHIHFSTFNSVQVKYTNIFIKQNRIEARLRPDGIWLK